MKETLLVALFAAGGAYAIAFVNPGLVSSTKRDPFSRAWRGLNAHALTLDVASYMVPHPEKAAKGEFTEQ